jgi:hypothetical protein
MTRLGRYWLPALGLVLFVAPISCAKKSETTATSEQTTPPPTTTAVPVAVVAVDLGRAVDADKQVTERVDVFKPGDTIYASVRTNGASPSSRIGAKWTYQDGQVVDQTEQTIAPQGTANTEFHIAKPDGLPEGDYKVEIFVDGSPAMSKDFKVSRG